MKERPYNSNAWGPLHDYRVAWYAPRRWGVRNLTARQRSPSIFHSETAAFRWLYQTAVADTPDPFQGLEGGLLLIEKYGEICTSVYGGVRFKNRLRSTQKGAKELKYMAEIGLIEGGTFKGGFKVWRLSAHGRMTVRLIREYMKCATSTSSRTPKKAV